MFQCQSAGLDGSAARVNLHGYLKHERHAVLAKLDGLSEYDVRRPMTTTETDLFGLVKHLATWEARYLGEVFGRLFNVLVHVLAETSRHAGHADILREEIDGAVGTDAEAMAADGHGAARRSGPGF